MDNPYEAPSTELIENKSSSNTFASFEKFSTWYVFGLAVITLGFYMVYWLFSRTKILNRLRSIEPIGDIFINISILLFFLSFFIAIGKTYTENNSTYLIFSQFISILSNIVFIVWSFKFKNRLNIYLSNNVPR